MDQIDFFFQIKFWFDLNLRKLWLDLAKSDVFS